eukprot:5169294-Prymnesium_polylepis.1
MPRSRPNRMHPLEAHQWPISARARPGRHAASELAAECRRRCRRDGCTCSRSARRSLLVADRFLHGRGPWPCSNPVAESRHGRTAACE